VFHEIGAFMSVKKLFLNYQKFVTDLFAYWEDELHKAKYLDDQYFEEKTYHAGRHISRETVREGFYKYIGS
jgi:hypothetical protein